MSRSGSLTPSGEKGELPQNELKSDKYNELPSLRGGQVLRWLRSADMRIMRIILDSITAPTKLYGVPSRLVVVVVLGLCAPLLGGWLAHSSGDWDLFERSGSITVAIGLLVASRRYFRYSVHELAMLRADDEPKSEMAELLEDVLTGKMGLALSAFGTIVWGWGKYLGWWSFSYLLVWAWFAFRDIYRDSTRVRAKPRAR